MNNLKNKAGFTLVELIVVIAILAILAGVAVPAYSGYMEKAKEAADTQVLSALNTAFAAACTENGVAITDANIKDVTVTLNNNESVKEIEVDYRADATATPTDEENAKATAIEDSFDDYFAGNASTKLGYYTGFDFVNGNFKGVKN